MLNQGLKAVEAKLNILQQISLDTYPLDYTQTSEPGLGIAGLPTAGQNLEKLENIQSLFETIKNSGIPFPPIDSEQLEKGPTQIKALLQPSTVMADAPLPLRIAEGCL